MKVKAKEKRKKTVGAYFRLKLWKPSKKTKKQRKKNYRREGISSKFNELHFAAKILRAW